MTALLQSEAMVDPSQSNSRRTDRDEGIRLLFGAAQDVARRKGLLADGVQASFANSGLERGRFKLRNRKDHLIVAIPVQEARDMLAYRRELAREVMEQAGVDLNHHNPTQLERQKLRIQPQEVRALAWAISHGRRVPYRKRLRRARWITLALLLCGVVPGLLFLAWLKRRQWTYQRELKGLVQRWREAGQPEPEASFFQLYWH